jgi:D-glycero-alpha-D-manno-heptose 1-phosphate guanylyltransferase
MEAIVLAGGLGTRLRSVVKDVPKPMALVDGKPFLLYILRYLKRNHINRVILSVGYKWHVIKDYFGDEFEGLELIYSVEDSLLGTGGAIKKSFLKVTGANAYIVNGDTFFDVDLNELRLPETSKLILSLKEMKNFDRYGAVQVGQDSKVINFLEKGFVKSGYINGGIYLASSKIFDGFKLNDVFSFEEFLEKEFKALNTMSASFDNYFIDIGIPEDYERSQHEFKK